VYDQVESPPSPFHPLLKFQMIFAAAWGSPLQSIDSVANGRPAVKPDMPLSSTSLAWPLNFSLADL